MQNSARENPFSTTMSDAGCSPGERKKNYHLRHANSLVAHRNRSTFRNPRLHRTRQTGSSPRSSSSHRRCRRPTQHKSSSRAPWPSSRNPRADHSRHALPSPLPHPGPANPNPRCLPRLPTLARKRIRAHYLACPSHSSLRTLRLCVKLSSLKSTSPGHPRLRPERRSTPAHKPVRPIHINKIRNGRNFLIVTPRSRLQPELFHIDRLQWSKPIPSGAVCPRGTFSTSLASHSKPAAWIRAIHILDQ